MNTGAHDEVVDCPGCGLTVSRRGFNRHGSSRACEAARAEREMAERELVRATSGPVAGLLKSCKVPFEVSGGFQKDGKRRRWRSVKYYPKNWVLIARWVDAAGYTEERSVRQQAAVSMAGAAEDEIERFAAMVALQM